MLVVYYWISYEAAYKRLIHNLLRPIRACPEIYSSSILVVPYPILSYPILPSASPHLRHAPIPLELRKAAGFRGLCLLYRSGAGLGVFVILVTTLFSADVCRILSDLRLELAHEVG